jgi:hypothetical protein
MRRQYTALPVEKPDPGLGGAKKVWTPMLKVRVSFNHQNTPTMTAYVDSGSPYCMFNSAVANFLHIDLKKAQVSPLGLGGVVSGQREPLYFHKVGLTIESNWVIEVLAGFSKKLSVQAILGRSGFFDKFRITFDHSQFPPEFEIDKIELVH